MMNNADISIEDWLKEIEKDIEPTWKRLGFPAPPATKTSYNEIGIIIIDDIAYHPAIHHLTQQVKQVKVNQHLEVSCLDIMPADSKEASAKTEHGLMVLQLLAHQPITVNSHYHVGLIPSAQFIFLSEFEPQKIKVALQWILQYKQEWNIRILLNLMVPNTAEIGTIKPTSQDPFVQALSPAAASDLLVVAANGNSKAHNNLHPADFFTIGGYDDKGTVQGADQPYPAMPAGLNGDGHFRPDILAPCTYLPVPYLEQKSSERMLSYFGGTCGAATIVAGACANLFSQYPDLTKEQLQAMFIHAADRLDDGGTFLPKLNMANVLQQLLNNHRHMPMHKHNDIDDPAIQRAASLTYLIEDGKVSRADLWGYLKDDSPIVRKVVIASGLASPQTAEERALYWEYAKRDPIETGEKLLWLYQLLKEADKHELDQWIDLLTLHELEITLCVKLYLETNYETAPEIVYLPDPSLVPKAIKPVLAWYQEHSERKG
ncbi:S8 family serine peptidase [Gracilibacillus alcaliphilus]|uniref:S8 family serine peptidase n=1 Tax=Gracilibacillus alcaliphilus TaxID=1401441 RepID=UPI00195BEA2F|nr:S8 family serine peptidase [Gracilibacillus alcaliphilus]MBM7677885.1 serine protease AprX [Gracilibacillus alcaliphilus]